MDNAAGSRIPARQRCRPQSVGLPTSSNAIKTTPTEIGSVILDSIEWTLNTIATVKSAFYFNFRNICSWAHVHLSGILTFKFIIDWIKELGGLWL